MYSSLIAGIGVYTLELCCVLSPPKEEGGRVRLSSTKQLAIGSTKKGSYQQKVEKDQLNYILQKKGGGGVCVKREVEGIYSIKHIHTQTEYLVRLTAHTHGEPGSLRVR